MPTREREQLLAAQVLKVAPPVRRPRSSTELCSALWKCASNVGVGAGGLIGLHVGLLSACVAQSHTQSALVALTVLIAGAVIGGIAARTRLRELRPDLFGSQRSKTAALFTSAA